MLHVVLRKQKVELVLFPSPHPGEQHVWASDSLVRLNQVPRYISQRENSVNTANLN